MKTPEELAEEYASRITRESERFIRNDIEVAFFAGYQAAASQWISVKQNVPEINHRVLLATNLNKSIVTGYRLAPAGPNEPWFHTDTGYWCGTETVTHWMPLPKPPENP
jgi:hypothetical protein